MHTEKELEENWSNTHFQSTFEPTLNPFKNGLLINYKKVGTRFFGQLLSLPFDVSNNKIQMDLIISKHSRYDDIISLNTPQYQIKYEYETKFCYTEFDVAHSREPNQHPTNFLEFSNTIEFLKYCEVENYNELFFNNKKDIIFIIRNPIHRFFSGIIQIIYTILYDISENEDLINEIIFYTGLTKDDIINTSNSVSNTYLTEYIISSLKKNEIELLISFIIEKKWNLIFQDIHTDNYLFNYVEWIHHVKDKTKIKIIDLKDCLSNKSLDFFTNLLGTDILKTQHPKTEEPYTYWDWMRNQTGTNKPVYKLFIDKILQSNSNFFGNSAVEYYLRNEYEIYDSLINSPYYINLND
jgi:hypothetical protein